VPPLDFTRRRVVLLPAEAPAALDSAALPRWLVFTADDDTQHTAAWWRAHYRLVARFPDWPTPLSPITWANKPAYIYQR